MIAAALGVLFYVGRTKQACADSRIKSGLGACAIFLASRWRRGSAAIAGDHALDPIVVVRRASKRFHRDRSRASLTLDMEATEVVKTKCGRNTLWRAALLVFLLDWSHFCR